MKTILTLLFLASSACCADARAQNANPPSAESAWITGPESAFQQSAAQRRPVLVNFTGSDWCIWCHHVRDEIFVQKHFLDFARDQLVLLEVDSPREKKLPAVLEKQNNALKEKYAVTSYPTLLLLDADGKELGRLGYMQGGPKTFVRELKRLIAATPTAGPRPSETKSATER